MDNPNFLFDDLYVISHKIFTWYHQYFPIIPMILPVFHIYLTDIPTAAGFIPSTLWILIWSYYPYWISDMWNIHLIPIVYPYYHVIPIEYQYYTQKKNSDIQVSNIYIQVLTIIIHILCNIHLIAIVYP